MSVLTQGGSTASASGDDSQRGTLADGPQALPTTTRPVSAAEPLQRPCFGYSCASASIPSILSPLQPGQRGRSSEGVGTMPTPMPLSLARHSISGSSGLECLLAACQLAAEQEGLQASAALALPASPLADICAFPTDRAACVVVAKASSQEAPVQLSSPSESGLDGGLEYIAEASDADGQMECVGGGVGVASAEAACGSSWPETLGPTAAACAPKNRRHKSKVGLSF